jgi:hypothetical protein
VNGTACNVTFGTSIGVSPDGKYLVAVLNEYDGNQCAENSGTTNTTQGTGTLLTIPIGTGGVLGTPVGQLDQVVSPFNDQMLVH